MRIVCIHTLRERKPIIPRVFVSLGKEREREEKGFRVEISPSLQRERATIMREYEGL